MAVIKKDKVSAKKIIKEASKSVKKNVVKTSVKTSKSKNSKVVKKSTKKAKVSKTSKTLKTSNKRIQNSIDRLNSNFGDYDEEEDKMNSDLPKEFEFKGKEKDLEKKLKEEEDIFIKEDDDDKDPEEPKDEDIIATEEFEESLEDVKGKSFDIFEGVSLDDPVRMYLKEIGQYSLLNIEQEKNLAKKKQEAQVLLRKKKLNETLPLKKDYDIRTSILNPAELRIVKDGGLAQERLVSCNLRLVVSIAKKYIGHGLSLLDLIQEGNLGLVRGIEKFDYKMGFKLSTYVTWWIRQAVSRALADQSKTIRIPVHMVETINRLNKVKKKLTTELGYEPNIKQIAKAMKVSEEKVEEVLQIAMDPISLDKPVGDEDDSIVADFIADQNVISPETNAERVMLKEQIGELLSGLKEREKKVLTLRFGIDDDHPRTLEEVGKELNVTRERIRQIEDKALRKLKYRAKNLQQLIK